MKKSNLKNSNISRNKKSNLKISRNNKSSMN